MQRTFCRVKALKWLGQLLIVVWSCSHWAVANSAETEIQVDLKLVLAVDVSNSMDRNELELQRRGYAAALQHQDVVRAIQWGAHRRIAVAFLEWAGPNHQRVLVPWTLIHNRESAGRFANQVANAPVTTGAGTSISGALAASGTLLRKAPFRAWRQVIDISGDGINNAGPPIAQIRNGLIAGGVTINSLPVVLFRHNSDSYVHFQLAYLRTYFENCVIGGTGAFLADTATPENFVYALLQKLVLEIAAAQPTLLHTTSSQSIKGNIDCARVGERQDR
jgi:hypothetical protein